MKDTSRNDDFPAFLAALPWLTLVDETLPAVETAAEAPPAEPAAPAPAASVSDPGKPEAIPRLAELPSYAAPDETLPASAPDAQAPAGEDSRHTALMQRAKTLALQQATRAAKTDSWLTETVETADFGTMLPEESPSITPAGAQLPGIGELLQALEDELWAELNACCEGVYR